jgi:hypothetical protein
MRHVRTEWLLSAFVKAMAGFLLSFSLSILIVIALAADLATARRIEQYGIDASMWVSLLFGIKPAQSPSAPASPSRIVFIDIDAEACERLSSAETLCLTEGVTRLEVVNRIGDGLRDSQASLIILDLATPAVDWQQTVGPADRPRSEPNRPQGDVAERFLATWSHGGGPLVVAAISVPPGEGRSLNVDWNNVPGGASAVGRLRYATAETWPDRLDNGRIRRYPLAVEVNEYRNNRPVVEMLPSLPFAAALYASNDRRRVDCVLYKHPLQCRTSGLTWNGVTFSTLAELSRRIRTDEALRDSWGERFLFTLPSQITQQPNEENQAFSGDLFGSFEHRWASAHAENGRYRVPRGHLRDAIVIVGSSAAAANDWHDTPLGAMTGAEIVANATRAFEVYTPLTSPSLFANLSVKISFALLATLAAIGVWLRVQWHRAQPSPMTKRSRLGRAVVTAAVFALAVIFSVGLVVAEAAVSLNFFPELGESIDVIFPILIVFAAAFVDIGSWMNDRFEDAVRYLLGCLGVMSTWASDPPVGAGDPECGSSSD